MKTEDGRLEVISGASRCGKTSYVAAEVEGVGRICAWDPEDQWAQLPGWVRVTNRRDLLQIMNRHGPQKVAYVAGGKLSEHFNFWAGVVMYACRYVEPLAIIAEELADVTSPSKAPGNWGVLLRRGLKRGAVIYAISQRWAEADKTALGNSSSFIIFRQNTADDARYMARKTRVPQAEIDALRPFEFIRYQTYSFEKQQEILPFAKKIPEKKAANRSKSR